MVGHVSSGLVNSVKKNMIWSELRKVHLQGYVLWQ